MSSSPLATSSGAPAPARVFAWYRPLRRSNETSVPGKAGPRGVSRYASSRKTSRCEYVVVSS
jgi:hypothetical protein